MKPWRQLSSKLLVQDQWISLRADVCVLSNGSVIEPYYVLEEAEWVHVFAQADNGQLLIVRQYRYAANVVCMELPGGAVDVGETVLDAAKRELREETGYTASDWTYVGHCFANPARQTNRLHLFIARGLLKDGAKALDASEDIVESFATPSEVKGMMARGEFCQALHIASFYRALDACAEWGLGEREAK